MSTEELWNLIPSDGDVQTQTRYLFLSAVKTQSHVHGVFFNGVSADSLVSSINSGFNYHDFATAYVAQAIARVTSYKFDRTVNGNAAKDYIDGQIRSSSWKSNVLNLLELLFTRLEPSFQTYMNDKSNWAKKFAAVITSKPWLSINVAADIAKADPSDPLVRKVNFALLKIHLLDNSYVQSVTKAFQEHAPGFVPNWNNYDYIRYSFAPDDIIGDVQKAINVEHSESPAPSPYGGGGAWWAYHGTAVRNFVNSYCPGMNLATGKQPDNEQRGVYSCFTKETQITLASGKQLPIEQVTAGTKILAHGGDISTVTEEDVQNHAPDGHYTFGINEDEPFFAPSHPFWTTDGWKCLFPAPATEENPHMDFKQLQIGDIVFRIVPNTDTLMYKPVRIRKISMKRVDCPFTFYGLHLDGVRSYHANGYVVAANYPVLTEKRIKESFQKLSEEEQLKVSDGLRSMVPELNKLFGGWLEQSLTKLGITSDIKQESRLV